MFKNGSKEEQLWIDVYVAAVRGAAATTEPFTSVSFSANHIALELADSAVQNYRCRVEVDKTRTENQK